MSKENFVQHMKNRQGIPIYSTDRTTQTLSPKQAGPSQAGVLEREPPRQGESSSKLVHSAFSGGFNLQNQANKRN